KHVTEEELERASSQGLEGGRRHRPAQGSRIDAAVERPARRIEGLRVRDEREACCELRTAKGDRRRSVRPGLGRQRGEQGLFLAAQKPWRAGPCFEAQARMPGKGGRLPKNGVGVRSGSGDAGDV